jgi:sulfite exporter TauE/SafE
MVGALALYYRSLGTAPTLLIMGNISGRLYMKVMTYNALAFSALKQLGNYRWFYTISFENPKTN